MPIIAVRCHVLGGLVTRVTDLEGAVTRILCPAYDESSGLCRRLESAQNGGPLSQLLERVAENRLDRRTTRCELR
jgi:hypothetical protein